MAGVEPRHHSDWFVDEWLGPFENPIPGNSTLDLLVNTCYQIVIEDNSYRNWLSPDRALMPPTGDY